MTRFLTLGLALGTILIGGCTTVSNIATDLSNDVKSVTGGNMSGAQEEPLKAESLVSANNINKNCPQIVVVDELSALSEFADISRAEESNLISRVQMQAASSNCIYNAGTVRADVKLVFESVLGQRGKAQNNDRPFFSYPFFVAVTDANNNILAKEVFAASMTYERDENRHTYYENLRQIIPIERRADGPKYKILVGFQLSDKQLEYNRDTMVFATQSEGAEAPAPEDALQGGEIIDIIKTPQDAQQEPQAQ